MKLEVSARIIYGTVDRITKDETYSGPVFIDAHADGTMTLMKPTSFYTALCEEHRKRGIVEPRPLDRLDHRERDVLVCGKIDAARIYRMAEGSEIEVVRSGFGIICRNKVRKMIETRMEP